MVKNTLSQRGTMPRAFKGSKDEIGIMAEWFPRGFFTPAFGSVLETRGNGALQREAQ
jgi:hypothetical protein